MRFGILALMFTGLFAAPAFAECSDDVCMSLQKILQERSGNFAKLKAGQAPRQRAIRAGRAASRFPG